MRKHVIVGTFGKNDDFAYQALRNERVVLFPLKSESSNSINFGISSAIEELTSLGLYPNEIGLDLLILASHIYAADTRISRQSESQDGWTRELHVIVPVSDPVKWSNGVCVLERMLKFLTGDLWQITFRQRPKAYKELVPLLPRNFTPVLYNKVQLLSGGLDSLIGAIDNLEVGNSPIFVSHAGDGATSDAQNVCYDKLKDLYTNKIFNRFRFWLNIKGELFNDENIENTTRGRSFLFFAIGLFVGTGFRQAFTLEAPENGLIALNIPLDVLRLGSLSTHTTHPFYMDLWNELLDVLNINGVVLNPYWNKTKGEMATDCNNRQVLEQLLPDTISCSSPSKARYKGIKGRASEHCGYCLPCIIRRASIKQASIPDTTQYTLEDLIGKTINTLQAEGQQIRSFQLAINRITKNPRLAKLLVRKSGPLAQNEQIIPELGDVYLRGMKEVNELIKNVRTEPVQ